MFQCSGSNKTFKIQNEQCVRKFVLLPGTVYMSLSRAKLLNGTHYVRDQ